MSKRSNSKRKTHQTLPSSAIFHSYVVKVVYEDTKVSVGPSFTRSYVPTCILYKVLLSKTTSANPLK